MNWVSTEWFYTILVTWCLKTAVYARSAKQTYERPSTSVVIALYVFIFLKKNEMVYTVRMSSFILTWLGWKQKELID